MLTIPFKHTDGGTSQFNEYNDCQVRATSLSTGLAYSVVHEIAAKAGRKKRQRFNMEEMIDQVKGFEFQDHHSSISLKKFVEQHPEGEFIARIPGHVFVICDGVVLDSYTNWLTDSDTIVKYWRVLKEDTWKY